MGVLVSSIVGSMGMISISFLIEQSRFLKKALMFFGKNSLTIMLTHEYLQIRSSIQNICERMIFMDVNIREYIVNNFKDSSKDDIKETIVESIKSKDEVVLPGMGVLFEIVWNSNEFQDKIIDIIFNNTRKSH